MNSMLDLISLYLMQIEVFYIYDCFLLFASLILTIGCLDLLSLNSFLCFYVMPSKCLIKCLGGFKVRFFSS